MNRSFQSDSPPSCDALLEKRLLASLASINADGTIHLVPMWFRRVDDSVMIPTSGRTRKAKNIRRHPYVSVMIQEARSELDLWGVLIKGPVHILEGTEARAMNRSIHLRYVTEDGLAQPPVAAYLTNGDDITLCIGMETVVNWDLTSGQAAQSLREPGRTVPLD